MNRRDFYFDQEVSQAELDGSFDWVAEAISGALTGAELVGIEFGLSVIPSVPMEDMNVNVVGPGGGVDKDGEPLYTGTALEAVDCSVDEYGASTDVTVAANDRYVSVFMRHTVVLSVPKIDGNGLTVQTHRMDGYEFVVRQGAMAATGTATPPALLTDGVLLADVLLSFGTTQIVAGLIEVTRREDWLRYNGTTIGTFAHGTSHDAITAVLTMLETWSTAMPFAFTGHWFGAVDPAGAAPPPLTVQAALEAIVFDLAHSALEADPAGSGANLIGTHGYISAGGYVQWAAAVDASVQEVLEIIATAVDGHIAGGAPAHPDTAVTSAAQAGTPESWAGGTVRGFLTGLLGHINDRTERAAVETISGAWRFNNGTVVPAKSAGRDSGNPRFENKMFARCIQGGSESPYTSKARVAAGLYGEGFGWASPLDSSNGVTAGTLLQDICVAYTALGNRRIYVFDDTSLHAFWWDPDDAASTGDFDFAPLFPAPVTAWSIASVCTDGTNLFISVVDTGGTNVHRIAACDQSGTVLPAWAAAPTNGSRDILANGLTTLALSHTDKCIVAKIDSATGLATRIVCASSGQNCGTGHSLTTIDAADGSIIAAGDGSAAGFSGGAANYYPSGGLCTDGVHVYATACDPSGAPPIMTSSGFYHADIEDPAAFVAKAGIPADISASRSQSIVYDGDVLWYIDLIGTCATYEMREEKVLNHSTSIGAARFAVVDGLNIWVQVIEAADDNVCLLKIPCCEWQSTTSLNLNLSVRLKASMTLESEAGSITDNQLGRMCWDGDSVWMIMDNTDNNVRRLPRAGLR